MLKDIAHNLAAEGVSEEEILNICKEGISSGKSQTSESQVTKFYIVDKSGTAQVVESKVEPEKKIAGPFPTQQQANIECAQYTPKESSHAPWVANTHPNRDKR